jgi:hypothetical protein
MSGEGFRIALTADLPGSGVALAWLRETQLWIGPLDPRDGDLDRLLPKPPGVNGASLFWPAEKLGAYRLRIVGPGTRAEFALSLLKDRQGALAITCDAEGRVRLAQFAPAVGDDQRSPDLVSKIEQVQNDLIRGEAPAVPELIKDLERRGVTDPVVASIKAALTSQNQGTKALALEADRLISQFPDLPDGHVARARAFEAVNDDRRARDGYRKALTLGLPILLPFLQYLWNGVRVQGIRLEETRYGHILQQVVDRKFPLQIWSAWRP